MISADLHTDSRIVVWADTPGDKTFLKKAIRRMPFSKKKPDDSYILSIYDFCLLKVKLNQLGARGKKMSLRLKEKLDRMNYSIEFPGLPDLKRPLLNFHEDGFNFMVPREAAILGDQMGSGKTSQAIASAQYLISKGKVKSFFCIVKSTAVDHWANQFDIMYGDKASYQIIRHYNTKKRFEQYSNKANFYIISLDTYKVDIQKIFSKIDWYSVGIILDEAHKIKNQDTKRAGSCYMVSGMVPYRWALTGIPIDGKLESLYGIMKFLDIQFFVDYHHFEKFHLITDMYGNPVGYKNIDELRLKLKPMMIRRTKEEVLPDMPPKTYNTIWIDLSKKEKKLYKDLKNQCIELSTEELNEKVNENIDLVFGIFAQSFVDAPILLDPEMNFPSTKMKELADLLGDMTEHSKVVVFTKYARMCHILHEWLPWKSIMYTGEMDYKQKEKAKMDFLLEEDNRLFIMDTAGAESIDLHGTEVDGEWINGADYLIFFDSLWNPTMNEQIEDRIHRVGKDVPVNIIYLRTKGTIEEKIHKVNEERSELFYRVIDEKLTEEDIRNLL